MKYYTAISIPDSPDKPWRSLHIFNLYRLIMTGTIAVIFFFTAPGDTTLGADLPDVFTYAISLWLAVSLINGFASRLRWPKFQWQVAVTIVLDIGFITLLMYTSGGMESGLGTLMLVTVAASGILLSGTKSFAFAALATLSILAMHSYSVLLQSYHTAYGFTHIGLLGVGLFAVALLTHTLALRIRESEALASQRTEELADLSQINELIIQQMETGIIVVDSGNNIQLMNESAELMTGETHNYPNRSLKQLSAELETQLNIWRDNRQHEVTAFRIVRDGAEILPHFKHLQGKSSLSTLIFLDDTSLLSHRAQQARLASLGRLTASIAHEIRNPLSAIKHAGQLLDETESLSEGDHRLIDIIQQQTSRLNNIVENILSLSRKNEFRSEEIDITEWLKAFHKNMLTSQQLGSHAFKIALPSKPVRIQADPTHLEQIMCNLYENGVRHSKLNQSENLLKIECSASKNTDNVTIDIIDYGNGVPEQYQEKLFEPFFTTEPTGTGLGLFIARELSQLNRAHLQYIDEPGNGAHFRLKFSNQR
jgi:two-component system sensor histidine kinase PilS (NtrC family)